MKSTERWSLEPKKFNIQHRSCTFSKSLKRVPMKNKVALTRVDEITGKCHRLGVDRKSRNQNPST